MFIYTIFLMADMNGRISYIDTSLFDSTFYSDVYPDLKAVFGYDSYSLKVHYFQFGLNEGRIANAVFDPVYYLNRYSDLAAAYGTDYYQALAHFITYGIKEGRSGSIIFDVNYYLNYYSDLKAVYGDNYEEAVVHYLTYGISEGRRGSLEFDVRYYLNNNQDLLSNFGSNGYRGGIIHFIQYGLNEGRSTSEDFILNYYKANYSDLVQAFGSDNMNYFIHYLQFGLNEGRIANYLITTSDVNTEEATSDVIEEYDTDVNTDTDIDEDVDDETETETDVDEDDDDEVEITCETDLAYECADLINEYRVENELEECEIVDELMDYAMVRAEETVTLFAHERLDGTSPLDYYDSKAEIITKFTSSSLSYSEVASKALTNWQNSSGHNEVMLTESYDEFGVGCVSQEFTSSNISYTTYYFVALFR